MFLKITNFFYKVLKSNKFYIFILIFFIFESVWIALSAAYPQAFDENFHFGLIKYFSTHLNPFTSSEPKSAYQFGLVFRDPSYLYHYLMSYLYLIIKHFTSVQIYQIVILRFIDIIFFSIGLIFFRKIFIKLKISKALTNISLLLFCLIPIVPQMAGQINYDDLLFALVGIIGVLSLKIIDQLKNKDVHSRDIAILFILCTFTALVKYAFLPIYLGIVLFFIYLTYRVFDKKLGVFFNKLWRDFIKQKLVSKILIVFFIILSLFMFTQRDLVNLIEYGAISPNCSKVLTVKDCSQYYVWKSDYKRHQLVLDHKVKASSNPFYYTYQWFYWMWYRLFFAINGPKSGYTNYPPLPLPSAAAIIIFLSGLFFAVKYFRKIFSKNYYFKLLLVISLIYLIALFVQGYITYNYTAVLENMNGRYLIPILLFIIIILAKGFEYGLNKFNKLKVLIAILALLLFIEGGGFLTYVVRSDDSWYINSNKIIKINKAVKKITKKAIIKDKKTYSTNMWFFN